MNQPIWIRERKSPEPPATAFRPAFRKPRPVPHRHGGGLRLVGKAPRPLPEGRKESDPALIEIILIQYRFLILVFSVWIFKR